MNQKKLAREALLEPAGLTESGLIDIVKQSMSQNADDGDLYLQNRIVQSFSCENGRIRQGSYNIDRGLGIRVVSGEKSGFAYSNELDAQVLKNAGQVARQVVDNGQSQKVDLTYNRPGNVLYSPCDPINGMDDNEQVRLLQLADSYARQLSQKVSELDCSMVGCYETVMVVGPDGRVCVDVRPLVRFNVQVIAVEGSRKEQGFAGGGGRGDLAAYCHEAEIKKYVQLAVDQALTNLEAEAAPAGTMPVVLGPGWPGVLLHEAVGHGLEADFNRKGSSAFSDRIGEQVASQLCTVMDNGAIEGRRGSLNMDDEGTPTEATTLIENGILRGYMQDKQNARLMGMNTTGNARRESYAHLPIPRMTNTYLANGPHEHDEVIASVNKGLYAVNFSGGQVEVSSGKFVFTANEAYLIENGRITRPVKNATLIGSGQDVLQQVSMVANNSDLDSGIGVCGKDGQSVPVGVGQPTVKVDELTVGGNQT